MTPARTVQCPVCQEKPERKARKLWTSFPESLMTTTAITDIRLSHGGTATDATPTVTSTAIPIVEPGPSSEDIVVAATGPEVESNPDVTDFINDNGHGEGPNSNNDDNVADNDDNDDNDNDDNVAEEIYNNEDSPDIIFYS